MIDGFFRTLGFLTKRLQVEYLIFLTLSIAVSLVELIGFAAIVPAVTMLLDYEKAILNPVVSSFHEWLGAPDEQPFVLTVIVSTIVMIWVSRIVVLVSTLHEARYLKRVASSLTAKFAYQCLTLPYRRFSKLTVGEYLRNINGLGDRLANGMLSSSVDFFSNLAQLLLILVSMMIIDPGVSATILGVICSAYCLIFLLVRNRIVRLSKKTFEGTKRIQSILQAGYNSYISLTIDRNVGAFVKHLHAVKKNNLRDVANIEFLSSMPRNLIEITGVTCLMLVLYYLYLDKGTNGEALPTVIFFVVATYRALPAAQRMYHAVNRILSATTVLKTLVEYRESSSVQEDFIYDSLDIIRKITFQDISLKYGESEIFSDFSLEVPLSNITFLRGDSGSGKSTLLAMLIGVLSPDSGGVKVNGIPLERIPKDIWYSRISYLSNKSYLQEGLVITNIIGGSTEVDYERLNQVLDVTDLKSQSFFKQSGLSTVVSENGNNLSQGECARIALAKALYKDSDLVVIDEALANIDVESVLKIYISFVNVMPDRTLLVVSHRGEEMPPFGKEVFVNNSIGLLDD